MMKKLLLLLFFPLLLSAEQAVGVTIDLLPPALSAMEGEFGFSAQGWFGSDRLRMRVITAKIYAPEFLVNNDYFKNQETAAFAIVGDLFFEDGFKGFWLGFGGEIWQNSIKHKDSGVRTYWSNTVATLGGGYVIYLWKGFYINPWWAVHYTLNNRTISVGDQAYTPLTFQGEISLKIGWKFSL